MLLHTINEGKNSYINALSITDDYINKIGRQLEKTPIKSVDEINNIKHD